MALSSSTTFANSCWLVPLPSMPRRPAACGYGVRSGQARGGVSREFTTGRDRTAQDTLQGICNLHGMVNA